MITPANYDDALKLDNQLCFVLYALSRKLTAAYRPLLEPLGLTYPQYLVLLVLWQVHDEAGSAFAGIPIKHLCHRLMLDTGTLTPLLKRLQGQGVLTRLRSAEDEREVLVALTEHGLALRQSARHIPVRMLCESRLSLEELLPLQQRLRSLLMGMEISSDLP